MLMECPDASEPERSPPTSASRVLYLPPDLRPLPVDPLYVKMVQKMTEPRRAAELARITSEIKKIRAEIQEGSHAFSQAAINIVKRAIKCGHLLRFIKAVVGHGNFENWCHRNLDFSIRKAQYYMALSRRHADLDILKLDPQSLRQALICAGILPEDSDKQHEPAKSDKVRCMRKRVQRLLLDLNATEDCHLEELLREIQPIIAWWNQLATTRAGKEKQAVVVDNEAEVKPKAGVEVELTATSKTQHDAFLPAPAEEPTPPKGKEIR